MASVVLKNVSKIYEGNTTPSVSDFNLEIKDKEFVVFVGPSGCGKSTTLRMVAGLEEISKGEIYIDDVLVNDLEPIDRDIAMVFQNYALYPQKTVYENIAFALKYKKIKDFVKDKKGNFVLDKNGNKVQKLRHYTRSEIDEKVIEVARILEISELLDRKPKALSGGQRQRVAIGRAFVRHPKVFLMDEPLSNLDAKLRNQMRTEIILLRKRIQTTFIYVTHDQIEAMTLGDRIVVMKNGVVQQIGTPTEVFSNPKNVFVATFIGTPQMNIFDAKLFKKGTNYSVDLFGKEFKISDKHSKTLLSKKVDESDVIFGIRPDYISFTTKSKDSIEGKILVSEMMGTEYHIQVDVNGKVLYVKTSISSLGKDDLNKILSSETVYIKPDIERIHLFDKKTQESIL